MWNLPQSGYETTNIAFSVKWHDVTYMKESVWHDFFFSQTAIGG